MIDPLRRTGRTYRMVMELHQDDIVIVHAAQMKPYVQHEIEKHRPDLHVQRMKILTVDEAPEKLRGVGARVHIDHFVFETHRDLTEMFEAVDRCRSHVR